MKFPYITQLKYCRKFGFEADTINKLKLEKKSFSKSSKFRYIMQLKYCQKLDFEAGPIHKLKTLFKKKTILKLYCPKLDFEAELEIMFLFPAELAAECKT